MKKTLVMLLAICLIVSFTGCGSEEMDYNNPDVTLFVKQLKTGTYKMKNDKGVVEVPHFTEEDIPELLNYEALYFLTDEEVLDAAACYRRWWEERQYPKTRWTIDPCYDEPLCGTGYRWW